MSELINKQQIEKRGEPHCPKCKEVCYPRSIKHSVVYDCAGCKGQISSEEIEYWKAR